MPTRRAFLASTSKAVAATTLAPFAATAAQPKKTAPSDAVRIALIGCRSMGFGDLQNAMKQPGVQCVALCDIDQNILAQRAADVEKQQGTKPVLYGDFRKLLEDKAIDAVIVGTPDHWHCLITTAACAAGKDVYVEKPLANSIAECDAMVTAARKYKRVVQVGQQQRSGPHWQEAMAFIKAGHIGKLRQTNVWGNFNYGIGQPKAPDEPVPAGVDYNMWLGPAPQRAFNKTRFHGSWRMFWDYGGGLITDWGVHLMDMALWAKDIQQMPLSVAAAGGNFAYPDHAHETFDTMSVVYQLPEYVINWQHNAGTQTGPYGRNYGLAFVGNDATLVINREGWELLPETENGRFKVPAIPNHGGGDWHEAHMQNFLDCIKTRKDPACPVENGRLVAAYMHMGNIALRTGTQLQWQEDLKNFGTNPAANALLKPAYRKPWVFPA